MFEEKKSFAAISYLENSSFNFDIPYFKFGYYSTMISIISKLLFTLLLWVLFLFLGEIFKATFLLEYHSSCFSCVLAGQVFKSTDPVE